jgi:hypothetical protein
MPLVEAAVRLFFDPAADGVSADAEGPFQATQAGALIVGPQDFFAPLRRVTIVGWILTALSAAGVTAILLFPVRGKAVFHELCTPAVPAGKRNRDRHLSTLSRGVSSPPAYHTIRSSATTAALQGVVLTRCSFGHSSASLLPDRTQCGTAGAATGSIPPDCSGAWRRR